jgi:ankyrin repeat protein
VGVFHTLISPRRFKHAALGLLALLSPAALVYAAESRVADAAELARWSDVRALVEAGSDVNAAQADGTTALLWAAYHRQAEAARWLLDAGAAAGAANRYGLSALAQAAAVGDAQMVGILLAANADANATMPEGDTALMLAARSGSLSAVQALLAAGARVDARDAWHGETALMWAAGENHADVVRVLAGHGAAIDAVSTAFTWDLKQTGVASQLPRGGLTALLHAAREDALEAAAVLFELGANPNLLDAQGLSPLRVAITNGNLDIAKLLLERGANADDGGLVEAAKLRALPWVRAAKDRVDQVDSLEIVKLLLDAGADVHKVPEVPMVKQHWVDGDHANEPALFIAAMGADVELMKLLAQHGAQVERSGSQSVTRKGATLLMASLGLTPQKGPGSSDAEGPVAPAIATGNVALELGADVNAAKKDGMTALHMAAEKGSDELVKFLLANGAKLDLKDKSNRLAIDVAKGVARIPQPDDPPGPPGAPPKPHESTIALLRTAMSAAGVAEAPYADPRPAK